MAITTCGPTVVKGPAGERTEPSVTSRPSYLESEYTTGTILIDTDGGTLTHSNGDLAYGLIEDRSYVDDSGSVWPYSVCRFSFTKINLGGGVVVSARGKSALMLEAYSGDLVIGANIRVDGDDANADEGGIGRLGGYSGLDAGSGFRGRSGISGK